MKAILSDIFRRSPNQLAALDGIRSLALVFTVLCHGFFFTQYIFSEKGQFYLFLDQLPWYIQWVLNADLAVDAFFVLSAFLLSTELFSQHRSYGAINWKWFYAKRLLRIYPLYVFALAFYSLNGSPNSEYLWANLLAVNNFFDVRHMFVPWSWSITVELQFYLICPWLIVLLLKSNRPMLCLGSFTLLSLLWQVFFVRKLLGINAVDMFSSKELTVYYFQYLHGPLLSRLADFIFGVAAAWLLIYHKPVLNKFIKNGYASHLAAWLSVTVLSVLVLYNRYFPHKLLDGDIGNIFYNFYIIASRPIASLTVASIIVLALLNAAGSRWINRILSNYIFFPIAKVSYSIYLFNPLFIFICYRTFLGGNKITSATWSDVLLIAILAFILAFIFGILCYVLVENWFIKGRIKDYTKKKLHGDDPRFKQPAAHREDRPVEDGTVLTPAFAAGKAGG